MILDGKKLQGKRIKTLKRKVSLLKEKAVLVIIQVGNNKESEVYINQKIKFGKEIGIEVEYYQVEKIVDFDFMKKLIGDFNNDGDVGGIIVQLPMPKKFDSNKILDLIDPEKDVDGLNSVNLKKLMSGEKGIVPATSRGIKSLLDEYRISVASKNIVIIGRSLLVGRSTANYFLNNDATVTVCHSKTKDLNKITKEADMIIVATGKPGLLKKNFVKKGQVIIDVGTTLVDGKLKGDADFEAINKVVSAISPVPGGIGPMTVVSLFENLIDQIKKK